MADPKTETRARNVSLTGRINSFVDAQVENGRHQNASEVVREALRRYESEIEAEAAYLAAVREVASEGRQAIRHGNYVSVDSDDAKADLFERLSGRKAPWRSPKPRTHG